MPNFTAPTVGHRTRKNVSIGFMIILNVFLFRLESASGADKFKKEDEVEVFFLNSWLPGTVVETDRRETGCPGR